MIFSLAALLALPGFARAQIDPSTPQQWHRLELSFSGATHTESASAPNPFLDYRLQCTLTSPTNRIFDVPGFFDTDGLGATSGSVWKCRFAPDEIGSWTYTVSFRTGTEVAASLDPNAGTPTAFDGSTGAFTVAPSDKTGRDFRAPGHGRLVNTGAHYLRFAGSGQVWVKGGPNIPENFFGYAGFDNTPNPHHTFAPHVADWTAGDPDWGAGAGKGIIGALNYIASTGANSIYFIPNNVGGDGNDTFPTITTTDKVHYDTSKLLQWETVFTHADGRGIFVHFQTIERENQNYYDAGTLGPQRKLYYRELIARFGHHLGIEWDLGEENGYGSVKHKEFAAYIRAVDPYDHPITTHTKDDQEETFYAPLLGDPSFDMTAFQTSVTNLGPEVASWRQRSATAGHPWVISVDEGNGIQNDLTDEAAGYPFGRKRFMWPVYLSGGGGFEWYVEEDGGGQTYDQRIEDFREMAVPLAWTRYALDFLSRLRLLQSAPAPTLSDADHTLAEVGRTYAVYVRTARAITVDLSASTEQFVVRWLNPRDGTWSSGTTVTGGALTSIGAPPFTDDAAALIVRVNDLVGTGFCSGAADCDDGSVCTSDACEPNGLCSHNGIADGTSCDDGNTCNGVATCQAGQCVNGVSACDDQNPCTVESCDGGGCVHTAVANGTSCADGDVCNGAEICQSGTCAPGQPLDCQDANPCTTNTCNPVQGCQVSNNSLPCNDGFFCTQPDVCSGGACSGTVNSCSDSIACTVDSCNEATDTCNHQPNNAACDDTNACTTDTCVAAAGCSHAQTCATDAIAIDLTSIKTACGGPSADTLTIPAVTVAGWPNRILAVTVGAKEDNGDCNMAHASMAVAYRGTPLTRAIAGLSDTSGYRACDGIFYLLNPPLGAGDVTIAYPATVGTAIDDRLAVALVLYNVAQQAPEAVTSAGADALTNPVTTNITTVTNGAWVLDVMNQGGAGTFTTTQSGQTLRAQTSCGTSTLGTSTKLVATAGSTALGWQHSGPKRYAHALAAFAPAPPPPPTTTTLSPTTTTVPPPTTTVPPTTSTTTTLPPPTTTTVPPACTTNGQCNDGNACTSDSCVGGICQHADISAACNDGAFCNGAETCNATLGCQAGTPPATNDGIACTTDACNEANDTITHIPNNGACSDGAFCNGAETCSATLGCQAGAPPTSDGIACTTDACNEATDTVTHTPNNASCDDNAFCNGTETCSATLGCQAGTPPSTSDGIACTTDACNEATDTITHTPNNGACSDGAFCNGTETCSATLGCQAGAAPNTNDGIACTTDACNEASDTITHTPNNVLCDDGNVCTNDVCSAASGCSNTGACSTQAIQLDQASLKSACGATASNTISITGVPVASLANRVLVVAVAGEENNADCNMAHANMLVTYAGQRLTLAVSALSATSGWRACNGIFYLLDPPVGTANVSITFPATVGDLIDAREAGAFVLYNVAQQAPQVTKAVGANTSTNPINTSVTTLSANSWVVDVMAQGNTGTFGTTQAGQTLRWQQSCGPASAAGSTKEVTAAGATTLGWTHTKARRYAHALAAFAPAPAPAFVAYSSTSSTSTSLPVATGSSTSTTAPSAER